MTIQEFYEVAPLVCPKCQGSMKIISIIEDFDITAMRPSWTALRSLKESKILTNIEKAFVTLSK